MSSVLRTAALLLAAVVLTACLASCKHTDPPTDSTGTSQSGGY